MFIIEWVSGLFLMPVVFFALCLIAFLVIAFNIDSDLGENDRGDGWFWATVGIVGLGTLLCNKLGITFAMIKENPSFLFIVTGIYFVTGTIWAFGKWYFHLVNVRDKYLEFKNKFAVKNNVPVGSFLTSLDPATQSNRCKEGDLINQFAYEVNCQFRTYTNKLRDGDAVYDTSLISKAITPQAAMHKSRIMQWIAFWPVSFTWTIINDPVRKIANYIFTRIKGTFQRMADSMFAKV